MRVLIGCEYSGRVRQAFRDLGHDAWSCDLLPSEDNSPFHIQGDIIPMLGEGWDLMIAHPPCTRLTNSGVRWLHVPPAGRTKEEMWAELEAAAEFYCLLRDAPIKRKAIENPVMHKYARERVGGGRRQVVQPYWFGDPFFKATGFELINLPDLKATNMLTQPLAGTAEYKAWSAVHRMSPGPERWKERSRTYPGVAKAIASQWGNITIT